MAPDRNGARFRTPVAAGLQASGLASAVALCCLILLLASGGPPPAGAPPAGALSAESPLAPPRPDAIVPTHYTYVSPVVLPPPSWAHVYYVDSNVGSDANDCAAAQHPATPKQTVEGVMGCDPGAGEIVRFRGLFTETIFPGRNGTVLYEVEEIAGVGGNQVTFTHPITNVLSLSPATDFVAVYGSRKGNSGAFPVTAVSGNTVAVDTSDLPAGEFLPETAADPGSLQAAIVRPVQFRAWNDDDPPVFNALYQAYHAINRRVILVSHLKSIAGVNTRPGPPVWPAFEIDGDSGGNSDFQIFDHLEVLNAESAIAVEAADFQSNYDILQYNYLHDVGTPGNASDEILYFGRAHHPEMHHDFVQIMYNRIGPHIPDASLGDGIDLKPSAHNATLFGNEIVGVNDEYCDDAPIKIDAVDAFVANNYLHDIHPVGARGCGISIVDADPTNPAGGGAGAIVANNIIANVRGVGIRVLDADRVQVLNNTIYNIPPDPGCNAACMEENMGIEVQNWQGSTAEVVIKNNIVARVHIGIGRYIWSHDEFPVSIDSDYNVVFETDIPFRDGSHSEDAIKAHSHDMVADPRLVDPERGNFALGARSPAMASGLDLSAVVEIDNHDAADPALPLVIAPILRTAPWDRGAMQQR